MNDLFNALLPQFFLGLVNGSIYALLSVGLTVIFGLLRIVNFVHGAQFMVGAFLSYLLLVYFGIGFWWSLVIAPLVVGLASAAIERTMISRLYNIDHMYGLLFTLGLTLVLEGLFRYWFGSAGRDTFYPVVTLTVTLAEGHHHVALLLSPYSYTTYKGS